MGYVELPDMPPAAGGRMSATLVLERHELLETVDLLKAALAELTQGIPNGVGSGHSGLPALAAQIPPAGPRAAAGHVATPAASAAFGSGPIAASMAQPSVVPPVPAAMPIAQPLPVQQQRYTSQQYQPQPQVQQQPQVQPLAQQMAQMRLQQTQPQVKQQQPQTQAIAMPQPQVQQRTADQQPQPQVQQPQPRVAAPVVQPVQQHAAASAGRQANAWSSTSAGPTAAAAGPSTAASSRWQMVYTTDSDDHSNIAVTAMAYAQALPGLPGGDGHAGWLVSASKGVLNLWETNRAVTGEEMALLCMHSQAVDVAISKLVLEPATQLCFGAALGTGNAAECVSVHSLNAEAGLLASRYKFAPPGNRAPAQQRLMQQVESLHTMNPALRNRIVTSYGERLLIFQTKPENLPDKDRSDPKKYTRTGSTLHEPESHFVAHPGSVITALHRSHLEGSSMVVTGGQDGRIHLWDFKAPPKQPLMQMSRHTKNVTGLSLVSDDRLASSSLDGTVLLWDLRSPSSPLYKSTAPGGAAVLKIAPGPWGDVLAVSTAKGLHCLELFDFETPMTNIAQYPLQRPFTDILFNTVTHDLYAGCSNGAIQVYSRQA